METTIRPGTVVRQQTWDHLRAVVLNITSSLPKKVVNKISSGFTALFGFWNAVWRRLFGIRGSTRPSLLFFQSEYTSSLHLKKLISSGLCLPIYGKNDMHMFTCSELHSVHKEFLEKLMLMNHISKESFYHHWESQRKEISMLFFAKKNESCLTWML